MNGKIKHTPINLTIMHLQNLTKTIPYLKEEILTLVSFYYFEVLNLYLVDYSWLLAIKT